MTLLWAPVTTRQLREEERGEEGGREEEGGRKDELQATQ